MGLMMGVFTFVWCTSFFSKYPREETKVKKDKNGYNGPHFTKSSQVAIFILKIFNPLKINKKNSIIAKHLEQYAEQGQEE